MRWLASLFLMLALGLLGCSETAGMGGGGGTGGMGGSAGSGGTGGMPECENAEDCNDDNECTDDACTVDSQCSSTAVADNTDCDFNGLPGLCISSVCEDAMLCEGVECDDDNECTDDVCDPADGMCSNPSVADGTACDFDGLPGRCMSGVCEDAMLCEGVICEDTECKTNGVCNPNNGMCDYTFIEDGTACSLGECRNGVCALGMPITVGCTNNVTSDVSIVRFDLKVDPGEIAAGSPFSADLTGVARFPEFFLDFFADVIPGGSRSVQLIDLAATVAVRSGATGADVELGADFSVLENRCSLTGVPCTGAPGQGDCLVIPSISNLCAQGFATVPVIDGIPNSAGGCTQPSPGLPVPDCDCTTCEALDEAGCRPGDPDVPCTKGDQCNTNGFCVNGDLSLALTNAVGSYTAGASGEDVLFGWFDGLTPPVTPQLLSLPAAVFSDPTPPVGMRVSVGGLFVAFQCLMGVDSGGPDGVATCSGGANDGMACLSRADKLGQSDGDNFCVDGADDGLPCDPAEPAEFEPVPCPGGTCVNADCGPGATCAPTDQASATPDSLLETFFVP